MGASRLAKRTSCWPAEFRHQNQSDLTARHVGFMRPGIKTPLLSIRFSFHPQRNKELPSAFQDKTSRSESLKGPLIFLIETIPLWERSTTFVGGVDSKSTTGGCAVLWPAGSQRLSGSGRVMIGPSFGAVVYRKPAIAADAVCFTPLPPCTCNVLPKITRLLNEFPSAAVWHAGNATV